MHYILVNGKDLVLDNLGAKQLITNAILKEGAFDKEESIESRFMSQIAGKYAISNTDYTFDNGYDVGSEIDI